MRYMLDGFDAPENDVDWAGADGLHDPSIHDAARDVRSVESKMCEDAVEVESGHAESKKKLIASFTYHSQVGTSTSLCRHLVLHRFRRHQ